MAKVIKDMAEFKKLKAEIVRKYGETLIAPSAEELKEIHAAIEPLCRFAKMRPEKMLVGIAQAYLRGE